MFALAAASRGIGNAGSSIGFFGLTFGVLTLGVFLQYVRRSQALGRIKAGAPRARDEAVVSAYYRDNMDQIEKDARVLVSQQNFNGAINFADFMQRVHLLDEAQSEIMRSNIRGLEIVHQERSRISQLIDRAKPSRSAPNLLDPQDLPSPQNRSMTDSQRTRPPTITETTTTTDLESGAQTQTQTEVNSAALIKPSANKKQHDLATLNESSYSQPGQKSALEKGLHIPHMTWTELLHSCRQKRAADEISKKQPPPKVSRPQGDIELQFQETDESLRQWMPTGSFTTPGDTGTNSQMTSAASSRRGDNQGRSRDRELEMQGVTVVRYDDEIQPAEDATDPEQRSDRKHKG